MFAFCSIACKKDDENWEFERQVKQKLKVKTERTQKQKKRKNETKEWKKERKKEGKQKRKKIKPEGRQEERRGEGGGGGEEEMLKRSIFAILAGRRHSYLPYIMNHHEHMSRIMQLYNRMTAQVLGFPYSCDLEWTSRPFKLESKWSLVVFSIISYQVWNKFHSYQLKTL